MLPRSKHWHLIDYVFVVEVHWNLLKSTNLTTGQAVLGHKSKRHQDWFDDNAQEIEHFISKKWQA